MNKIRLHRFPPLSQLTVQNQGQGGDERISIQTRLAEGFHQGMEKGYTQGYREGYDAGFENANREGFAKGLEEGSVQGRQESLERFEHLAQPIDAVLESLKQLQSDYQAALRMEVVELVTKVARQVIRCELTLKPSQIMALVDETVSAMPPVRDAIQVYLNREELQRIAELDPSYADRWQLIPDARLEPGECRVKAGDHEADAGCRQRLVACMEQINAQLMEAPFEEKVAA